MLIFAILLITAGAVLTFAVTESVPWISLQRVGLILIAVGVLTLVLAIIFRYTDASDGDFGIHAGQLQALLLS